MFYFLLILSKNFLAKKERKKKRKKKKKKCKCSEILRNIILKDKDKEYGV
jgi:hypothetical protein